MFSRLKSIVPPVVFSVGRLASTAGSALFNIQNVIKYFTTKDDKDPINLAVQIVTILANLWINLITRVPALFEQFSSSDEIEEVESNSEEVQSHPLRDNSIIAAFKTVGLITGLTAANGSYLGGITLMEFIAYLANSDAYDEPWKEYLIQSIALYFALSNLATFYSYSQTRIDRNGKKLIQHLNSSEHWNRVTIMKALGISSAGLISGAMLSYFSTSRALAKIPGINITQDVKTGISNAAAVAGFFCASITNLPAIYQTLMRHRVDVVGSFACESTMKWSSYMVGVVDAASTGMQNFIGVINTSQETLDFDENGYVIIPASICGVSTAITHYIFNVKVAVDDLIKKRIIAKQNYLPVSQEPEEDKEKGVLAKNPLVPTLFNNAPESGLPALDEVVIPEDNDILSP